METIPSDLSSGGSHGSDQASERELELPDSKLGMSGQTFPLRGRLATGLGGGIIFPPG